MEIPTDILEKYGVSTIHLDDEIGTYDTFLKATDYKIIKSYESLMSEPTKFITNLAKMFQENTEVIKYRVIARTELEKLKGE